MDNYIGFSTDPHAAAGGKVLLADMPPAQVLEIYQGRPLKQYGKKTIISFGRLLKELEEVRKHGYAIEDEEYCEGLRGVAAPVKAGGTVVAAISIRGSASTFTIERMHEELIRLITKTAENISSEMFGK